MMLELGRIAAQSCGSRQAEKRNAMNFQPKRLVFIAFYLFGASYFPAPAVSLNIFPPFLNLTDDY